MNSILRVGIIGYGVVGRRLADALSKLADIDLIGVADISPNLAMKAAQDRGSGLKFYTFDLKAETLFKQHGLTVEGDIHQLLNDVDLVCDATPAGTGAENLKLYNQFDIKIILQGGENVDNIPEYCCYNPNKHIRDAKVIKISACNTIALARSIQIMQNISGVQSVSAQIVSGINHLERSKSPIGAISVRSAPTYHATSILNTFPELRGCSVSAINVNAIHGHVNFLTVEMLKETKVEDIVRAFSTSERHKIYKIADGFSSTAHIQEYWREMETCRSDDSRVGVWRETIQTIGHTASWVQYVPHECIVVNETIDAIYQLRDK